jgi:multidrug efflux pump subunit AcrA (membrane-fusion protein)
MSVTAYIPTGRAVEQLTVHKDAVMRNAAGAYLYVARGGGAEESAGGPAVAAPVQVDVKFPVGDRVVVTAAGLQAGDLVVIEGNERLFPMMPITPLAKGAGAGPAAAGGPR